MHEPVMLKSAVFSPCRQYRYELWRTWEDLLDTSRTYAMFIGLNPSTADESEDDPTIRRCIDFARRWGYSGLCMTNLFAFRATKPDDMLAAADPVGAGNDQHLLHCARSAGVIVAAWGTHGVHLQRDQAVKRLVPGLSCLRLTRDGHPGHPLYLPANLSPVPLSA